MPVVHFEVFCWNTTNGSIMQSFPFSTCVVAVVFLRVRATNTLRHVIWSWSNFEIIWISGLQFTEGEGREILAVISCQSSLRRSHNQPLPLLQAVWPLSSTIYHKGEGDDLFLKNYILWFTTKSEIRPMFITIHYNPSSFPQIFCRPFSHRSFHAPVWQSGNTCGALQIISWTTWKCLDMRLSFLRSF